MKSGFSMEGSLNIERAKQWNAEHEDIIGDEYPFENCILDDIDFLCLQNVKDRFGAILLILQLVFASRGQFRHFAFDGGSWIMKKVHPENYLAEGTIQILFFCVLIFLLSYALRVYQLHAFIFFRYVPLDSNLHRHSNVEL